MRLQMMHRPGGSPFDLVPISFRSPGGTRRKPVAGGRWSVRRVSDRKRRPWHAYCGSDGKQYGASFATHAEAVAHAAEVAQLYAAFGLRRIKALRAAGVHRLDHLRMLRDGAPEAWVIAAARRPR